MLLKSPSTPVLCSFSPCALKEVDFRCDFPCIHGFVPRIVSCHHSSSMATAHRSLTSHGARHYPLEVEDSTRLTWEIEYGGPVARPRIRRAQSESDLASLNNGVACNNAASSFLSSSVEGTENFGDNSSSPHRHWRGRIRHTESHAGSYSATFGVERRDSILEESDISATEQGDQKANDDMNAEGGQEHCAGFLRIDAGIDRCEKENTELLFYKARNGSSGQISVATESRRSTGTFEMEDGEVYTSFSVDTSGTPVVCSSRGCRSLSESEKVSRQYIASGPGLAMEGGHFGGGDNSGGAMLGSEADPNGTEAYYRKWLQDDPQNTLLLRNFATFLYEVKHDYRGAEEFFERAIRASPTDGDVLSQYAKMVWDVHRDERRAEAFFNKAVQAAPDDCYVMGSYASFLWDSEDKEQRSYNPSSSVETQSSPLLQGTPPLVASA